MKNAMYKYTLQMDIVNSIVFNVSPFFRATFKQYEDK